MTRGEAEAVGVRVGERLTRVGSGAERARDQEMERRKEKHTEIHNRGRRGAHTQGGMPREGKNGVRRGGETGRKGTKRQSWGQSQSEKLEGKSNKKREEIKGRNNPQDKNLQEQDREEETQGLAEKFSCETYPPALVSPSNGPDPRPRPSPPSLARGGGAWYLARLERGLLSQFQSRWDLAAFSGLGAVYESALSSFTQGGVIVLLLHTRKPRNRGQVTLLFSKWQQPNTRAFSHAKSLLSGKAQDWKG